MAKYKYISDAISDNHLDFIAIMETGKKDMSKSNLNRLSGGKNFFWQCLPPKGRSCGILLRVNEESFDVSLIADGEFFYKISSLQ